MIVQGDVYFTAAKEIPKGAKEKEKSQRGFVIAEGEATGHAHVVDDDVKLYEKNGVLYLKTEKEVEVRHEEHRPVTIGKGIWRVGIVREYDPFAEEARQVRD